jgi:hypothetical protein
VIAALLTRVRGWMIAVAAAIGGVLLLVGGIFRAGRRAQQHDQAKAEGHARDARNRVDDAVRRAGDGTAADELRRNWRRGGV